MALDIVTVGPLNVDLLITGQAPAAIEDLVRWAGPSNVMLAAAGSAGYVTQDLAHFGLRTGIVSVLADDPFGDAVSRLMSEAGVEMSHVAARSRHAVGHRHLHAAVRQQEAPADLSPAHASALAAAVHPG